MKFLAIGDFHGKCPFSIRKIVKDNDIDFILCTGDLCNANQQRKLIFKYWQFLRAGIQFEDIIGKAKNKELMIRTIKSQDKILKKLEEAQVPVFLIYGNNDYPKRTLPKGKYASLEQKLLHCKNIRLLHRALVKINDYYLVGISGYNPKIAKKKASFTGKISKKLKKNKKVILLTHEPPYGYLDKVRWKASPMFGKHIGNKTVLKIIREIKPIFHICGHMHENPGKSRYRKTIIINHGPAYAGNYAIVDLQKNRVRFK